MKNVIVITLALLTACAIPDPQGGDNAPDVEQAPTPDAATVEKAIDPGWTDRIWHDCRDVCNEFTMFARQNPTEYGCAPSYRTCLDACVYDGDHVPEICFDLYISWLWRERRELPSACGAPNVWDPPYSVNAQWSREAYRRCWQDNVEQTR